MASQSHRQHFLLFPLMAQGHVIPMIDVARLLAQQGLVVTLIMTPGFAARSKPVLDRSISAGLQIHLVELELLYQAAGIPEDYRHHLVDTLPSPDLILKMFNAIEMLQPQVEQLFHDLNPRPSCIISDMCVCYTLDVARKFNVPRVVFYCTSCLCLLCLHCFRSLKNGSDEANITKSCCEKFVLPGLPDRLEFTEQQFPTVPAHPGLAEFFEKCTVAELASYGVIVNSFEELEPAYAEEYKKVRGHKRVWCIGPVYLCNKDHLDLAQRGNEAAVDSKKCLEWLDTQEPSSVVYACLGTLCNLTPPELKELALGLEGSKRPFVWVIRGSQLQELERWISDDKYDQRIEGRGFLVRGWAPQALILSHPSIGGFLTHGGWNSTLEGICAGVPLLTWPMFGDQFCNERLAVEVAMIGVGLGVEDPAGSGEGGAVARVRREDVKEGVEELMGDGNGGRERRGRVKELAEKAEKAMEVGGSSSRSLARLVREILQLQQHV
ncbi:UDP-glycosyltransferase 1-like [Rhodamnia argentea]|uniref:Glycosyltransferase n=1 Tax=Rhodamnia argentea TaxID=178133 RepID=A0A8B8NHX4_9MYRT|nr:UDP-glycosyltransferase 1-like [Rhodamnia argentea]